MKTNEIPTEAETGPAVSPEAGAKEVEVSTREVDAMFAQFLRAMGLAKEVREQVLIQWQRLGFAGGVRTGVLLMLIAHREGCLAKMASEVFTQANHMIRESAAFMNEREVVLRERERSEGKSEG